MTFDSPGDHQTIEEFLALLQLDSEFSLVVVEGRTDAAFYSQYLRTLGTEVSVISVGDRFGISREECAPYGSDFGEKSKAVALAIRVNDEIGNDQVRVTVIVDADSTASLGPLLVSPGCLVSTDFPSLEHYSMRQEPFARFAAFGIHRANAPTSAQVSEAMAGALRALSAIGATLHDHGIGMTGKATSFITVKSGVLEIDVPKVIERSLSSHSFDGRTRLTASKLILVCAGYLSIFNAAQHPGRGHDLAPLLIVLMNLSKPFNDPEVVEALLRASLHPDELHEYPLFAELRFRYS
jgi:hypothetical protein